MRTELHHLPPAKQRDLERVVQILFEEFEEARALATQDWKKKGRILKIILYGSYARGGWVDEPHTAKGYQSDFDLLIVVNDKRLTDRVGYWAKAEERLNRELAIIKTLKTPVNFIVHTLHEVNDGLAHARSVSPTSRISSRRHQAGERSRQALQPCGDKRRGSLREGKCAARPGTTAPSAGGACLLWGVGGASVARQGHHFTTMLPCMPSATCPGLLH